MENSKWTTDTILSRWLGQDIIIIHIMKDDVFFDTLFYVPCLARSYSNVGSARKAISMFNKRGGR